MSSYRRYAFVLSLLVLALFQDIQTKLSSLEPLLRKVHLAAPFLDQKPGTSGLRKSSLQFEQKDYLESFVESIFRVLPGVSGGTLILGGDGRYGNRRAIDIIIRMAYAHGIARLLIAKDGILSTPAASNLIRKNNAVGGIILSASHNAGGKNGDFGVKINGSNGGPASESLTNDIYEATKKLDSYRTIDSLELNLDLEGKSQIGNMIIEVIDGVDDYILLMQNIFDFDQISDLLSDSFPIAFDALHAVTGPYAKRIFEELLGASKSTVKNGIPLEDFGGGHPDPNLTYAKELSDQLLNGDKYQFGAACDGDGDRNMILGKNCFVNPSDSLAVLRANAALIPAFAGGLAGVARSMPTSSAVDAVAEKLKIDCYETPTGWKFFGNLLDEGRITICGEESFGTGSNHVREKDGLWAVLFWLQILAKKRCSVLDIMQNHCSTYGRHYYTRHDYESIESGIADEIYHRLEDKLSDLIGSRFGAMALVHKADNFRYIDPVDSSLSKNQGIRILLEDSSRVIVRMSGTGTQGATLRIYLERYVSPSGGLNDNPQKVLLDLINAMENIAQIRQRTGMLSPTVIT